MSDFFNFNDAGPQRSFDVIPDGTIVVLQVGINPGGIGPGGYESKSKDRASDGVDLEFIVIKPETHSKRKIFHRATLRGTTPGHAEAGRISRDLMRAIIESARGILPSDTSEAAQAARSVTGWHEIDGMRFVARLGVRPSKDGYAAKNIIKEVITPDNKDWKKVEQVAKPPQSGNVAPATAPPAGSVARPDWAG